MNAILPDKKLQMQRAVVSMRFLAVYAKEMASDPSTFPESEKTVRETFMEAFNLIELAYLQICDAAKAESAKNFNDTK